MDVVALAETAASQLNTTTAAPFGAAACLLVETLAAPHLATRALN